MALPGRHVAWLPEVMQDAAEKFILAQTGQKGATVLAE